MEAQDDVALGSYHQALQAHFNGSPIESGRKFGTVG
jgi:hypothetical protein